MTDTKEKIVNGMCQTWRHDFGLEKRTHAFGSSGMTDDERAFLTREMAQLYEHHVAPYVAEAARLEAENLALRTDAIRYRYMRDFPYKNIARAVGVSAGNGQWLQFDEADQVIDKAMADDEALRQELSQ
jgi:hypothetical protein